MHVMSVSGGPLSRQHGGKSYRCIAAKLMWLRRRKVRGRLGSRRGKEIGSNGTLEDRSAVVAYILSLSMLLDPSGSRFSWKASKAEKQLERRACHAHTHTRTASLDKGRERGEKLSPKIDPVRPPIV